MTWQLLLTLNSPSQAYDHIHTHTHTQGVREIREEGGEGGVGGGTSIHQSHLHFARHLAAQLALGVGEGDVVPAMQVRIDPQTMRPLPSKRSPLSSPPRLPYH